MCISTLVYSQTCVVEKSAWTEPAHPEEQLTRPELICPACAAVLRCQAVQQCILVTCTVTVSTVRDDSAAPISLLPAIPNHPNSPSMMSSTSAFQLRRWQADELAAPTMVNVSNDDNNSNNTAYNNKTNDNNHNNNIINNFLGLWLYWT